MSERIDFSANATVFDRRHGAAMSEDGVDRLWFAAGLQAGARVLDIGAGTGRVAIPLAMRGCRVVALDPATAMVDQLRAKARGSKVSAVVAEGAQLPFAIERFDVVVIARLLYLTRDWKVILHEACRVLAIGGCLLHEWGNGDDDEDWVRIREEARRLFEQAGLREPFHPGVRSEMEIDAQLDDLNFVQEARVEIGSGVEITLREFLRRLVDGELSYIWAVPDAVRSACLPSLVQWSERTFDLDRPVPTPRQLSWTVHRKIAAQ